MKKKSLVGLFLVGFICTIGSTPVFAVDANQTAKVNAQSGELSVVAQNLDMSFDIKQGITTNTYIHPKMDIVAAATKLPDEVKPENPYSNLKNVPTQTVGGSGPDSMVTVVNDRLDNDDFQLKLSCDGFRHVTSKRKLEDVYLYIGKFNDISDYKGQNRVDEQNELDTSENKYWLSDYTTLTEGSNVLVGDFRGNAGRGTHYISPFTSHLRDKDGYVPVGIAPQIEEEKNISFSVGSKINIPESGTYTTNLTWTIENTL